MIRSRTGLRPLEKERGHKWSEDQDGDGAKTTPWKSSGGGHLDNKT